MTFKKKINADIQVVGDYFANINRNKCKLIISNKKYPLKRVVPINDFNTNKIKMKMIFYENIYNKSCMFKNCELLESVSKLISYSLLNDPLQELNNNRIIREYKYTEQDIESEENSF